MSSSAGESESVPALTGAPAAQVRDMFARIAPTYDLLNHTLSWRRDRAWRRELVGRLDPGARRILDLCTGTGDLALEIAASRPGTLVCAGDFCFEMLQRGLSKGLGRSAALAACDALRLPFADATFDAVTVGFGVRNFEDVNAGLREIRRVTRRDGQIAVLEFFRSPGRWRDAPVELYMRHVLPRIGRFISHDRHAYVYLPESVRHFATRREFAALLAATGYGRIEQHDLTFGIVTLFVARAC